MNPMGHTTYTMVKLEQEHRLARLEHRRRQLDEHEQPKARRQLSAPTHVRVGLPRRLALVGATAAMLAGTIGAAVVFGG